VLRRNKNDLRMRRSWKGRKRTQRIDGASPEVILHKVEIIIHSMEMKEVLIVAQEQA
jgi:hypothetical protein